jgi:hypothetical protein
MSRKDACEGRGDGGAAGVAVRGAKGEEGDEPKRRQQRKRTAAEATELDLVDDALLAPRPAPMPVRAWVMGRAVFCWQGCAPVCGGACRRGCTGM